MVSGNGQELDNTPGGISNKQKHFVLVIRTIDGCSSFGRAGNEGKGSSFLIRSHAIRQGRTGASYLTF